MNYPKLPWWAWVPQTVMSLMAIVIALGFKWQSLLCGVVSSLVGYRARYVSDAACWDNSTLQRE